MRLSPDISLGGVVWFGIFFLGVIIFFIMLANKNKTRHSGECWYDHTIKTLSLDKYDNTFVLNKSLNNLTSENSLIYTSGEFIYVVNTIYQTIKKINKSDILKIDLDIYTTQKNVKRLVALTSTYDSKINITGLEMKIITKSETHSILMISDGKNVDKISMFDKSKLIDDANRCKLILEDDILNLNTVNN